MILSKNVYFVLGSKTVLILHEQIQQWRSPNNSTSGCNINRSFKNINSQTTGIIIAVIETNETKRPKVKNDDILTENNISKKEEGPNYQWRKKWSTRITSNINQPLKILNINYSHIDTSVFWI